LSCNDPAPDSQFDAVIYDLDSLPSDRREEVLKELSHRPPSHISAVHSFNLEENDAVALRQSGVAVHRRLAPELFHELAQWW
jgi:hypothetical protein